MVSVSSSASATDCEPISSLTFLNAASIDMPDSTQISSRSSVSGKARLIDSCRRCDLVLQEHQRQVHADIGGGDAHAELDHRRLVEIEHDEQIERGEQTRSPPASPCGRTDR